ncbi:SGNH/GDSL hydrolase family protein [Cohnella thermotolerans]|uniref:SGNH/GDSL hydrolase family protein n=1 Tax=Cohnella thermotolerans TaxID=329858 RepID=UPI000401C2BB|nr:SGNH/GDSL hydrolase family protein [Cohnella thermotolerans]
MKANENLKVYALPDIENMKVHGRTTGRLSPLTLFWTGSAIEFNAKGSELWVEVEVDYDQYEPWISVVVNSVAVSRQMLTAGRYWICIFRGMNANVAKNVRIVKDVQAMSGDPGCSLQFHAVKFDGQFLPIEEKPYKIEFIGDSITSGEGAIGAKTEEDWIPMWFSALRNYSAMTAEALNAEYRILSQSGWGVLTSWDNNPRANIPDYYEKVCGLLTGEKNEALGAFQPNDFDSWQPDVVVVNLGTNDGGAFHSPAWRDEGTGESHKQRLNEDGTFNEEDLHSFEEAARNFLLKLRKYNKKAHIVWAYGMLGTPMMPAIYRAVDAYTKTTGDRKVSVFQLPNMTEETAGARNHPGKLAHEKAAKELTEYLKGILPKNETLRL